MSAFALHPTTKAARLSEALHALEGRIYAEDWIAALRQADTAAQWFTDLTADVAQEAYNAGATKRAIAEALGVPVSTFRGMARS